MTQPADRSIADLLTDLSQNLRVLIRQEMALARAELTQSAANARRSAMLIGAGVAMAWVGALAIVAAACLGLVALGLPAVAATSIVGIALAAIGAALVYAGKSRLTSDRVAPRATVETMKDTAQLLRGPSR
jgi:hypothetical protein